MSNTPTSQEADGELREDLKQKLHDDERIKHAAKFSQLEQRILHLEAELVRERERNEAREEVERRGEIAVMKLMVHHAKLHGLRQQYEYGMHVLKSLEQFPDQPLASQNLRNLELQSNKQEKET